MKKALIVFITGFIFGLGLIISGMANPHKVRSFLDITGLWDPSLAFVMIGALGTTMIGYHVVFKRKQPLFSTSFQLPDRFNIDLRLISGAIIFGVGWGISGLCPGPALVTLGALNTDILLFFIALLAGMKAIDFIPSLSKKSAQVR